MLNEDRYSASRTEDGRYRLLVEAITDYAIYMLDRSGRVSSWNPGAERFHGYSTSEIIGRHFSCFYPQEDRDKGRPERALKAAAEKGKFETEGWRVRKDGSRFWAHVVIDPIRAGNGELVGFAKITRDLSERRAVEATLKRSEDQFRLLVNSVSDYAIYMLDPTGNISSWNAGAERIKGYAADEALGRHFSMFYTPEDRLMGEPARALAAAAEQGRFEKEAVRVRKDGSRFTAHVVIEPIKSPQGELLGFAKITRDVSERRETERKLAEARETLFESQKRQALAELSDKAEQQRRLYDTILSALPDLVFVFDLQHRFTYANPALLKLWGKSADEAIGKTCLELGYEPWHAAMHDKEIDVVAATRRPIRGEVPFTGTQGRRVYDYIFVPVLGPDGKVEAVAGTTRDVTDRKRHEERLELLIHELNHRVKNSLATVQSLAQQSLRSCTDIAKARDLFEGRLVALSKAHDILTRAHWEAAEIPLVVSDALAPYRGAGLILAEGPALKLAPQAALALSMALHELVTNALKYGALSDPNGHIAIIWRADGDKDFRLEWRESGGPKVAPPARRGFGTRLIEQGLAAELGGQVVLEFAPEGVCCIITGPVAA
jgi:PAS domain S-box-containing protein